MSGHALLAGLPRGTASAVAGVPVYVTGDDSDRVLLVAPGEMHTHSSRILCGWLCCYDCC